MLPVGEVLERTRGIVADRRDTEPPLTYRLKTLFQLDELDLAPGSPVGGTKEDDHSTVRAHNRLEGLGSTILICRRKRRNGLPHCGPGLDPLPCKRCHRDR